MKKILNIAKYIPFLNLLSIILFAIPIPLIYGFDKLTYWSKENINDLIFLH